VNNALGSDDRTSKRFALTRRIVFWIAAAATGVLLLIGVTGMGYLLLSDSKGFSDNLGSLADLANYAFLFAVEFVTKTPDVAFLGTFWFLLYAFIIFYCAQTQTEKKLVFILIPAALVAVWFSLASAYSVLLAGLAGQGAGH